MAILKGSMYRLMSEGGHSVHHTDKLKIVWRIPENPGDSAQIPE